jgi:porin
MSARSLLLVAFVTLSGFPCAAQDSSAPDCEPELRTAACWYECLVHRQQITGDWGGVRPQLADSGITFDADITQLYQGVTRGGSEQRFRYGGHGDYVANINFGKLGGPEGLLLKVRAEHNFGGTVSSDTGAFLPVGLTADLPALDSHSVYLTNLLFTQFLSESTAVFFGKLDTLDGDLNAFAHGRGKDQFLNTGFVANPALLRFVPYSTLGAGVVKILGPEDIVSFSVLDTKDTTKTAGVDDIFDEGVLLTAEGRFRSDFFGRPGHHLFGGAWGNREFVSLDQNPRFLIPGGSVPITRQDNSWAIYYTFDQYLVVDQDDPAKGWGVFGRAAITDGNPNPIQWFLSFGVGGSSPISGREDDSFGAGWFINGVTDKFGPITTAVLQLDNGQGIEVFYNVALTDCMHLTADLQVVEPAVQNGSDTALVAGIRVKIDL